jgi:eukaryotic-like serine/threonine-protein kinase
MSADASHPKLGPLFARALAVAPQDRAAFLENACGGDAALRRELDSLLRAHDSADGYF